MERASSSLLSWLLAPVAAWLVASALSLPRVPYTGLMLRGEQVVAVVPGGPGDRAGAQPGDRLLAPGTPAGGSPLAGTRPGTPVVLSRVRAGEARTMWLVPEPLPDGERSFLGALLAVGCGFVLLGGWVWGERRDRLTRAFFLLSLGFAVLIAPPPRWGIGALEPWGEALALGVALYLPALLLHFFTLFPEPRPRGAAGGRGVVAGYAIATVLFLAALATRPWSAFGVRIPALSVEIVQALAALWFAIGILAALVQFARSYRRAGTRDARRRLRVALLGTALGAGPLAALVLIRNLAPAVGVPGERWAVVLTLFVPASFAWAIVVHRIFDFRVALRAGVTVIAAAAAGVTLYAVGEWLASTWGPDRGPAIAASALAFLAVAAAAVGPLHPWVHRRVFPAEEATWLEAPEPPVEDPDQALRGACTLVTHHLRLDGCIAIRLVDGHEHVAARVGADTLREPGPALGLRTLEHQPRRGVQAIDELGLAPQDREALELSGVRWVVPMGEGDARAVLLLGRRLAGSWLGRAETRALERYAHHLGVALENAALRRAATTHGRLDRDLVAAGAIQAHRLPRKAPAHPTLDCAAAALSSEPVGGDYYDFVEGPGRDFTLAVGDAAGHGMPAALVLAGVQARFRSEARRGHRPGELLAVLNQELAALDQPERFMALLCARVEVRSGRVWLANAGVTPPLVRRRDGAREELSAGGLLLGVRAEAAYLDQRVQLDQGDVLVLYTDGLVEAQRGEELFGVERVWEVLDRNKDRRAADLLEALLREVRAFADQPLDDVTVVVLRQLTRPAGVLDSALKPAAVGADATG